LRAAPVIETARLKLRGHGADDLDAYAAMWADETVVRHIGGVPLTREQCWVRILQYRGMWAMLGFGFWVIEDRETGKLAGEAGLQDMRRDIEPSLAGQLECGWGMVPAFHGRGLAEEAVRALLDWRRAALPHLPVTCIIAPANEASQRLARKLGFAEAAQGSYRGKPTGIWRLADTTT
jgi:RimJ/RimL family protein N-acetyltransferase